MPIRTNRGRAAVYRRLWGWPLRSPRHLITTVVGLVVLVIVIATGVNHLHRSPTNPGRTAGLSTGAPGSGIDMGTSSGVPTGTTPPQTRLAGPPETPVSVPPAPAALATINSWAQAWVNHPVGMTTQQWLAQLQPYTTPEFLQGEMSSVDITNIPATAVTGIPVVVHSYSDSVEATVATNGGTLDITAVNTGAGWQVSAYNPVG
jgi:hypothetical protein